MDKYKRYYGLILFLVVLVFSIFGSYKTIMPKIETKTNLEMSIESQTQIRDQKQAQLQNVKNKIKKIKDSIASSQKRIFSPVEADLGNDTLFFTLYNDVLDMVRTNSVKIKTIKYTYNPAGDMFVQYGKDAYFVCDINLDLASNYVDLGKLIQDIYQYPYYVRINSLEVKPYNKDKKILLSKLSLRLYARTEPIEGLDQNIPAPAQKK